MGFCYQINGSKHLLCCDSCGAAGGVRRRKCEYGWCPATALCPKCRADKTLISKLTASCDEHCKPAAEEYAAERAKVAALHAAGEYVFCASVCEGDGVRCWFRNGDGETLDALLTHSERDNLDRDSTYSQVVGGLVTA